jgi:hypothetical protein
VVAGPPSAAVNQVLSVKTKMTPLRYSLQARHYELFQRNRKTPEKLAGRDQSEESELLLSETDAETSLGKGPGRKRKRKVFGCVQERIFPKMTKAGNEREMKKLAEITDEMEDSDLLSRFTDCSSSIQSTFTLFSASSLLSSCPAFFTKTAFMQQHMKYLADGNDIFVNCVEHLEFQMELLYQYLLTKLPKRDREILSELKEEDPVGNALFMFYDTLFKYMASIWKMDCAKLFYHCDENDKCHRDVPSPHAVIVGQDFSSVNIFVDFTLIYRNLTMTQAIPAIVALHYVTNVQYNPQAHLLLELLQKQVCLLSPEKGTHKPGKENFSEQSREIQSFQMFIGNYLYNQALAKKST